MITRIRAAWAVDDLDDVADLDEIVERLGIVRTKVDAAVRDVGPALSALRPGSGMDVLTAVGDRTSL